LEQGSNKRSPPRAVPGVDLDPVLAAIQPDQVIRMAVSIGVDVDVDEEAGREAGVIRHLDSERVGGRGIVRRNGDVGYIR